MRRFSKLFLFLQLISFSNSPLSYAKYWIVSESKPGETAEDFYRSCVSNNAAINDSAEEDCERQALQHPSLKEAPIEAPMPDNNEG